MESIKGSFYTNDRDKLIEALYNSSIYLISFISIGYGSYVNNDHVIGWGGIGGLTIGVLRLFIAFYTNSELRILDDYFEISLDKKYYWKDLKEISFGINKDSLIPTFNLYFEFNSNKNIVFTLSHWFDFPERRLVQLLRIISKKKLIEFIKIDVRGLPMNCQRIINRHI